MATLNSNIKQKYEKLFVLQVKWHRQMFLLTLQILFIFIQNCHKNVYLSKNKTGDKMLIHRVQSGKIDEPERDAIAQMLKLNSR